MTQDNFPETVLERMEGDSEIEQLHNRLNPSGVLAQAYSVTGGQNTGYYSLEEHYGRYSADELVDPKVIAQILSTDTEKASAALRLLDSTEDFEPHPVQLDILPLEISQEDASEKALYALKTIVKWTKKVANEIFNEMSSYELVARYLKFNAENLKVSSNDRRNQPAAYSSLKIDTRIINLSVRYEPVKDATGLLNALRILSNVTRDYYNYNGDSLINFANRIQSVVHDPNALAAELSRISPSVLIRSNSFRTSSDGSGAFVSPHLLGCNRLSIKTVHSADGLMQRYTVRLVPSDITPRPLPREIEFKRFPLPVQRQVLQQIIDISDYLLSVNTLAQRQRRMARAEKIRVVVERLAKQIENGEMTNRTHSQVISLINQYNDWVTHPHKELYGLVCRNLRAALNVCTVNAM